MRFASIQSAADSVSCRRIPRQTDSGDCRRDIVGEPAFLPRLGQRIDEPGDIGRSRTGHRAERRELAFIRHPHGEAESREEVIELDLRLLVEVGAVQAGDAPPDGDGEVGHRANDRRRAGKALAQARDLDAGKERHDNRAPAEQPAQIGRDLVKLLRLEGEQREPRRRPGIGEARDGPCALDCLAARADNRDRTEIETTGTPPVDDRAAHVAAADEPGRRGDLKPAAHASPPLSLTMRVDQRRGDGFAG